MKAQTRCNLLTSYDRLRHGFDLQEQEHDEVKELITILQKILDTAYEDGYTKGFLDGRKTALQC